MLCKKSNKLHMIILLHNNKVKRSDLVVLYRLLYQIVYTKSLNNRQRIDTKNVGIQKDYGLTKDGQLERQQSSNRCGSNLPTSRNGCTIKRTNIYFINKPTNTAQDQRPTAIPSGEVIRIYNANVGGYNYFIKNIN